MAPADLVILSGKPVIGVCLGSQFMAKALGATVRSGKALEIGMTPVTLTSEAKHDPVFSLLPSAAATTKVRGFDPPLRSTYSRPSRSSW